ncbi:MAG: DUF4388 domain-containing protein [Deltaproteobacteria bacterium]|nr:DUF4388 domain-containing protein [Deltaproteobacteria bacterium]
MPEYVKIDRSGKVFPVGRTAEAYLGGRAGEWRIVPAHPDLLVLRQDDVRPVEAGVRAVLAGDIQGLPLGEMLAYLAQSRWTGVITVATGQVEKSIFLRQGAIRWASSTAPNDRLGVVLGRLGLVDPGAIDRVMRSQPDAGARLGGLLLANKMVSAADLYQALKHQVQEIFFSVLVLEEGLYFLFNDPVEGRFAAKINLELTGMLMEGMRRFDEMSHFRDVVPGMHVYVRARERSAEALNEEEQALFDAATTGRGRLTLADLAAEQHLSEFDATKMVYGLAKAGYVDISEEKPEVDLGAATLQVGAQLTDVLRVFNTIFREVCEEVGAIAPTAGFRLGVESFLSSNQHEFTHLLSGIQLHEDGTLDEPTLLARLAGVELPAGKDPSSFLSDALNELMFFELFQAGELLPADRDEDLSRRVRVIYEMLDS